MFVSQKWRAKPENAFNFGSLSSPHLASWKFRGTMWRANVFLAEKREEEAKLMLGREWGDARWGFLKILYTCQTELQSELP